MIQSVHIENYRGFKDLKVGPFGQINLITGKNNVGKSALLECLYLNLSPGAALVSNLDVGRRQNSTWLNLFRSFSEIRVGLDNTSKWGWLFYGKDLSREVKITSQTDGNKSQSLTMNWWTNHEGSSIPLPRTATDELYKYLEIELRTYAGEEFSTRVEQSGHRELFSPAAVDSIAVRLMMNVSSRSPEDDTKWFSKLADVGRQEGVVQALQLIDPRLKSLAVSTSDGPALIYGDLGVGRRVPVSQMGEGMLRVLSLVLEITNAAGGVVLIDDIETGLHHSVLTKIWIAIDEAARRSSTQVFATTHSFECIRAAHEASRNSDSYDLKLFRLDRVDSEVIPIAYDKETLDTSVEMNLEVR